MSASMRIPPSAGSVRVLLLMAEEPRTPSARRRENGLYELDECPLSIWPGRPGRLSMLATAAVGMSAGESIMATGTCPLQPPMGMRAGDSKTVAVAKSSDGGSDESTGRNRTCDCEAANLRGYDGDRDCETLSTVECGRGGGGKSHAGISVAAAEVLGDRGSAARTSSTVHSILDVADPSEELAAGAAVAGAILDVEAASDVEAAAGAVAPVRGFFGTGSSASIANATEARLSDLGQPDRLPSSLLSDCPRRNFPRRFITLRFVNIRILNSDLAFFFGLFDLPSCTKYHGTLELRLEAAPPRRATARASWGHHAQAEQRRIRPLPALVVTALAPPSVGAVCADRLAAGAHTWRRAVAPSKDVT